MSVQSYRDLIAWQKAMDLVVDVYRGTESSPSREQFGLTNQARRAAVSVPSNVAEGQGRGSTNEYIHFLRVARGSAQELETQLILAQRLNYLAAPAADDLIARTSEVCRIISGLINALRRDEQ
ncbi:MAG TPA: four helix bundle protein [Gemmataceae bacterium]|nr:four helix bundle protein [Gemmataceae bacterium]